MNNNDRARGVTLHLLDLAPVLTTVPLTDDDRAHGRTAETAFGPYAMIEHAGSVWVVCSEGVGWEISDVRPLVLDVYASGPGEIGVIPRWEATLTAARVRELATGDEIDLADLVRTFGARLESNFWTFHRTLTA